MQTTLANSDACAQSEEGHCSIIHIKQDQCEPGVAHFTYLFF
jgi:hypothetical protein